jgi:hypothetical protein
LLQRERHRSSYRKSNGRSGSSGVSPLDFAGIEASNPDVMKQLNKEGGMKTSIVMRRWFLRTDEFL